MGAPNIDRRAKRKLPRVNVGGSCLEAVQKEIPWNLKSRRICLEKRRTPPMTICRENPALIESGGKDEID